MKTVYLVLDTGIQALPENHPLLEGGDMPIFTSFEEAAIFMIASLADRVAELEKRGAK